MNHSNNYHCSSLYIYIYIKLKSQQANKLLAMLQNEDIERLVIYSYDNVLGKKVYLHEGNWKIVDKHLANMQKELMKEVV